jgi:hypothetical protein
MSSRAQKLQSRREAEVALARAVYSLHVAEDAAYHMPKDYRESIEVARVRVDRLLTRVEEWPITPDECDRARMKKLADRAARQ